jgi:hypothetical protein
MLPSVIGGPGSCLGGSVVRTEFAYSSGSVGGGRKIVFGIQFLRQDLPGQILIHMRKHRLLKCEIDLAKFYATAACKLRRQIFVVDKVGE